MSRASDHRDAGKEVCLRHRLHISASRLEPLDLDRLADLLLRILEELHADDTTNDITTKREAES